MRIKNKKLKLIVPKLYNTSKRPEEVNNYSVWIHTLDTSTCQIFINGKWHNFVVVKTDNDIDNKIYNETNCDDKINYHKLKKEIKNELEEELGLELESFKESLESLMDLKIEMKMELKEICKPIKR